MATDVVVLLVVASLVSGLVSLWLAAVSWRSRSVPGARPFAWLMLAGAAWCLANGVWLWTDRVTVARAAFVATRAAAGLVIGFWVLFAVTYTGRRDQLTPARLALAFLLPGLYPLAVLTGPLHGLLGVEIVRVARAGIELFVARTGLPLLAQTVVSYGLMAAGYALLADYMLQSRNRYRKQTFLVLVGGLVTAVAHLLFLAGGTPHPGLNVVPYTFAVNGLIIGVALFRYDFLSVTPLEGDLLEATGLRDRSLDDLAPGLPAAIERDETFAWGDGLTFYDPQVSWLTDRHGFERARLVVLRDVTGQQRRQDRLEALQTATQEFIEADHPEEVAELSVDFATRVLDQNAAGVFLADDGALKPTAVSQKVAEQVEDHLLYVEPESMPDDNLWRTYETGEWRLADLAYEGTGQLETALMFPLGDHGVMAIGSEDDSYASEDEQYGRVLAQTTRVVLDQVERERELRQSRRAVERRSEQIEFFNGVLRHSLRNAMLVIEGRADHLASQVDDEYDDHLGAITDWCQTLTDMSESIRAFNETVTASEAERLTAVDLAAAAEEVAEEMRAADPAASIAVDLDGPVSIRANDLVDEVVRSVLRNAVEHNDRPEPTVRIDTQEAGDWLQLRIADDGPGIDDELKTTVFERSLSHNQTAGGFGLYFVSVMMDLYGGKVWFEDNDPRGTVAILEFQLADAGSDDTTGEDRPAAVVEPPEPDGGRPGNTK